MHVPLFDRQRFSLRHVLALAIHLPLTLLFLWMMLNARQAGGFNIVWLYFALFVQFPCVVIALSCIKPWIEGAQRHAIFRFLLIVDAAAAILPSLIMLWLTLAWAAGSWPKFFKLPFQLYSWATFVDTILGVIIIIVACGLYAWGAMRLIWALTFKRGPATEEDVMGELAAPHNPLDDLPPLKPEDDIMSPHYKPPPVVRKTRPTAPTLPRKLAQPTSYEERQARIQAVRGIEWPNASHAARAQEAGWPVLEWNLWHGEAAGPRGYMDAASVLHGIAHLAHTMSRDEAKLAALQVRSLLSDQRRGFIDERHADGDPQAIEEVRRQNRESTTVGQVAQRVYRHILNSHDGLESELQKN